MKNLFKILGIVVIAAAIAFSMTACSDDDDGGLPPPPSGSKPDSLEVAKDANGISNFTSVYTTSISENEANDLIEMFKEAASFDFSGLFNVRSNESTISKYVSARFAGRSSRSGEIEIDLSKPETISKQIIRVIKDVGNVLGEDFDDDAENEIKDGVEYVFDELKDIGIQGYVVGRYDISETSVSAEAESEYRFETKKANELGEFAFSLDEDDKFKIEAILGEIAGWIKAESINVNFEQETFSGTASGSLNAALNLGLDINGQKRFAKCLYSVTATANFNSLSATTNVTITIFYREGDNYKSVSTKFATTISESGIKIDEIN